MFSPNMLGLNLRRIKNLKQFFAVSLEWYMNLNAKPNKLWTDQGGEFFNDSMQKVRLKMVSQLILKISQ